MNEVSQQIHWQQDNLPVRNVKVEMGLSYREQILLICVPIFIVVSSKCDFESKIILIRCDVEMI
jgi:hypothetical protein